VIGATITTTTIPTQTKFSERRALTAGSAASTSHTW
jgi:hypothetical protein